MTPADNERTEGQASDEKAEDQASSEARAASGSFLGDPAPSEPILGDSSSSEPILGQPESTVAVYEGQETAAPAETQAPIAPAKEPGIADAIRTGDRAAIASVLERGSRLLFATAIFLVPVVFDPRTIDAFNLTKLTALWVFGVLAVGMAWYSVHLGGPRLTVPRTRLLRIAVAVLAVTALATLFSANRILSTFGLYHRYEGLISVVLYVGVAAVIVLLYHRRPGALSELTTAIAAAGGVAAAYVILQGLGMDVTEWRQASGGAPRFPIGPLGNSAFTASFLGIAAPFIVYRAIAVREFPRRVVWSVVFAGTLLALWFTGGRAGMLGAAAGVVAVPLFMSRLKPYRKVAVVAVTLFALVLTPIVFGDPTDPAQTEVLRTGTAGYRVQIWDASFRMFTNRPVLGWGPESFYGQYPRFRRADEARRTGLAISDKPHSIYLGWATSTGAVGFIAYVLLFGTALVLVAGRASRLAHGHRLLAATFGAGLVAYLVQGVYSIDVPPLALMGWVCVGAIAALLDRRGAVAASSEEGEAVLGADEAPPQAESRPRTRLGSSPLLRRPWVLPGAVGLLVLILLIVGFRPLRADHAAWAGERRTPLGWSSDTMDLYEKAIDLNPREAAYRGLAGAYLERVVEDTSAPFTPDVALRRSASFYLQALELQPRNVYFMINVARVYTRLGTEEDVEFFERGNEWMGQAVNLDPLNPQMRDLYVDLLNQWQEELRGRDRRQVLERAQTQAGIAQQLRAGRVIP